MDTYATSAGSAAVDRLVGHVLDRRYLVGARIARGGMATVYEATDLRLDRRVALKVVPEALSDDETFSRRFVREARAAARLTHPNVVAVYDQGEDSGVLFLAMEYVAGRHTLRDTIRAEAPLPPSRALAIMEEVLKAIAAAHESGIIHRDIKPENVLIDLRGQVKVADFGLARAISSATSATSTGGVLMGTVSYLPPELVTDGHADARSDVYSLGVLTYELLTGTKPHEGDSPIQVAYKHVHHDVPAPSSLVEAIPPYVDAFVARATSRERDVRPADAHVMLQQLRRVRHALDRGVLDDQELTDDLTPTTALGSLGAAVARNGAGDQDDVFDVGAYDDFSSATARLGDHPTRAVSSPVAPAAPRGSTAVGSPPDRRGRRRGLIALVVVLLLAAAAALGGWYYGVGRFAQTPDLLRLTQNQAEAKVHSAGLSLTISGATYSETVDEGHIVSTDPGPGDQVARDGAVIAVISKGPERHKVPDLSNMTKSQATAAVTSSSLSVGQTRRRWSESVHRGGVITFRPHAGKPLHRGDPVTLVVSRGPAPIKVTDHTGQSAQDAAAALDEQGLQVRRREHYDDGVAAGLVVAQTPPRGVLHSGDPVTLVVSRGPHLVEVPDVFAQGVEAATQTLTDAGFEVETVEGSPYLGLGYVSSVSPGAGEVVPYGSTITLQIV